MSTKEEEFQLGSELIARVEAGRNQLQEFIGRVESSDHREVNAAAQQLDDQYDTAYKHVETVGFASPEAQDALVSLLLFQELFDRYRDRITQAKVLELQIDEGAWILVEIFSEYFTNLVAGSQTFDLSDEEFETILVENWLPHLDLVKQCSAIQKYKEYVPFSQAVEALLENENLPDSVSALLQQEFSVGKKALQTKILDKKQSYLAENSVRLDRISKRYAEIHNDAMLLLLLDADPQQKELFLAKSVAVLNANEVKTAMIADPYDRRLRDVVLSLSYILGFGEPLQNELRRLGITETDMLVLFATSLPENLESTMGILDVARAMESTNIGEFRRVFLEYLEHFLMQEVTIIQCGDRPIVASSTNAWSESDVENLSLLLEDLDVPQDDDIYLQALERNEIKRNAAH